MKIETNRKKIEELYEKHDFDTLFNMYEKCVGKVIANSLKDFYIKNPNDLPKDILGKYLVDEITSKVRYNNKMEELKDFEPINITKYQPSKTTREEDTYFRLFEEDVDGFVELVSGNINKKSYDALKQIYEYDKDNYYTGIHRTGALEDDIFIEGIKYGSTADLHEYVQRVDNFDFMLGQIGCCENYKFSTGTFIIKYPKNAVNGNKEPIYYEKDNDIYLNPKYVVAYVPVLNNRILDVELNDEMDLVNSTLSEEDTIVSESNSMYNRL